MKQENEFVLPEKWCVKNYPETLNWIRKNAEFNGEYITERNFFYMPNDRSRSNFSDSYPHGYTEITRDEFKEHVLKDIPKPEYDPKDGAFKKYDSIKAIISPFNGSLEDWNSKFNEPKIIGYKLIKPEYKEAFAKLINIDIQYITIQKNFPYHFSANCEGYEKLKELNVLELWCEPVYDTSITLKSGVKLSEDDIAEVKEILNNK